MKIYILITLSIILFSSIAMTAQQSSISIKFEKNDKEIQLNDDFTLILFYKNDNGSFINIPHITNNSFTMDSICFSINKGYVYFKYKQATILTGTLSFKTSQNMEWTFGYDDRPKQEGIKREVYLILGPLEHGEGVQITSYIHDIREYKKSIRQLLKNNKLR